MQTNRALTDEERIEGLLWLQETFADPLEWTHYVYKTMGMRMPEVAERIVVDFYDGHTDDYIGAERGTGKSTTLSIQVPRLTFMDPSTSTLILSGAGALSSNIYAFITKLFRTLPELRFLLPPDNGRERQNDTRFEIYEGMRNAAMSATVQTRPINRIQGERGFTVICDDIETLADYTPAAQRKLDEYIAELSSIKYAGGRVVIVGTPQCKNSVYFRLPEKGYRCLVYPGRYPTKQQVPAYRGMLAPWIMKQIADDPSLQIGGGIDGTQGKPTSPSYASEEIQQDRELKQGSTAFQIRHMLNPAAFENSRQALDPNKMILINEGTRYPLHMDASVIDSTQVVVCGTPHNLLAPVVPQDAEYREPSLIVTSIDPAFGGAVSRDRTGVVTVAFMDGYAIIIGASSIEGGFSPETLARIADATAKHGPSVVLVEKNADAGMFSSMLRPFIDRACREKQKMQPRFDDKSVTGKKEHRIIGAVDPILGGRKLCITREALEEHDASLSALQPADATENSLFYQLANMTHDGSLLRHDDMADALASALLFRTNLLAIDTEQQQREAMERRILERANVLARGHSMSNNAYINSIRRFSKC